MTRMHAAEANFAAYYLPSSMSVRFTTYSSAALGDAPAYVYAYWAGIDSVAHVQAAVGGPRHRGGALRQSLERAIGSRPAG